MRVLSDRTRPVRRCRLISITMGADIIIGILSVQLGSFAWTGMSVDMVEFALMGMRTVELVNATHQCY